MPKPRMLWRCIPLIQGRRPIVWDYPSNEGVKMNVKSLAVNNLVNYTVVGSYLDGKIISVNPRHITTVIPCTHEMKGFFLLKMIDESYYVTERYGRLMEVKGESNE